VFLLTLYCVVSFYKKGKALDESLCLCVVAGPTHTPLRHTRLICEALQWKSTEVHVNGLVLLAHAPRSAS
jgi:hypothetical protein